MNFQDMIMRLNQFWAAQGCVIWQPHNEKVGAGTANPATVLRVLGPEPWNVAYPEPSARPDDGRYGENPNRWYQYYQYQVILKPDPGDHIDRYLESLEALGIDRAQHDIRFVEDNWQQPSLAAWGLGWEVWLDGLEISQYTYFQQAAGLDLDPVSVEITYGLERIALFLQGVQGFPQISWRGDLTYGDIRLPDEIDYCTYNFELADTGRLQRMYELFEEEARAALARGLVAPAHDYILRCSHTFNVLDARGAVSVTQRAHFFARMRDLSRQMAAAYLRRREELGYPLLQREATRLVPAAPTRRHSPATQAAGPADFLLEIGTEELPAADVALAIEQLRAALPERLAAARLDHGPIQVAGTPRRLAVRVATLAERARDEERVVQGPPASIAFDAEGKPTRAAEGFARRQGLPPEALERRDVGGKSYLVAVLKEEGRPALALLGELIPALIAGLRFPLSMRWNATQVAFSRPIRWLVALYGEALVDASYAGVTSDRTSYGLRPHGSPAITLAAASDYDLAMREAGITVDPAERRAAVAAQVAALAAEAGASVPDDPALLEEVTNLVEQPVAIAGGFDPQFLALPPEVLVTVMKKHQRYFPLRRDGALLPAFITIANGGAAHADVIRAGNEAVVRARFSDARFFYAADTRQPLRDYLPKLDGLTVQERLGSYLDKTRRLERLGAALAEQLALPGADRAAVARTAALAKADLATTMVVEFTSLQGTMGRHYAERSGEPPAVAAGLEQQYLPRFAGDRLPDTWPGVVVGLADRLDTLAGFFAIGLAPSGSADPYGLRRAALGLLAVLIDRRLPLSLRAMLGAAAAVWQDNAGEVALTVDPTTRAEVAAFVERRLEGWLEEQGFRPDLVAAALSAQGDTPSCADAALRGLAAWAERPEFPDLLRAYARAARITRDLPAELPLDPAHLQEPPAQALLAAYQATRRDLGDHPDLDALLAALRGLVAPIDAFFADILVMDPDPALRDARLGLLQRIAELPKGMVDLSKVAGF